MDIEFTGDITVGEVSVIHDLTVSLLYKTHHEKFGVVRILLFLAIQQNWQISVVLTDVTSLALSQETRKQSHPKLL